MRYLILSLAFLLVWVSSAFSDSLDGAPAASESQAPTFAQQADTSDSLHQSTSVVQNWILPLALVVAVGTSFVLLFVVRSR
jgi:hypothetical protein